MESVRGDDVASGADPEGSLVTRSREVEGRSFRAFLDTFEPPRTVWTAPDEPTIAAAGAAATLSATGSGRAAAIRDAAEALFARRTASVDPDPARPRLFGGFAFHDNHADRPPWSGFPGAWFVLPAVQLARDGERTWLTVAGVDEPPEAVERRLDTVAEELSALEPPGPNEGPPGVRRRRPTTSRADWRAQVRAALDRIERGDLRKVVLAQSLSVDLERPLSVPDALARLRSAYPDCHRFLVQPGDGGSFFGATPERLVALDGRRVRTAALAGSTGRGDTPAEDDWLAAELLASEKDIHEHELVVEAIADQLAPFSSSVRTGQRTVRTLANVQHLRTPVSAELDDVEHVLDLVAALHPTPAVGGLPPEAAWRTIRETESFDRGWYAAPIGWFDAAGNGTFAVAIRSAVAAESSATLFAGAGIVADSDPDREWDEVQLKYRPMLDALEAEES